MDSRQPGPERSTRGARRPWARLLPWGVLVAVGVVVYGPAIHLGFTSYDDTPLIVDQSARLRDLGDALASFHRDAFALLGPRSRGVFYRPILWISYVGDARIAGVRPGPFHATNLALHLLACSLVLLLLRRLGYGAWTSLLLSLVLLLHPALVSVVGWIPCRNDALLAIFAVASALSMLAFLERPDLARGAAVLAGVALTLFTKESGLAVLAVLPALPLAERGTRALRDRSLWSLIVGMGGVALGWALLRRHALGAFPVGAHNVIAEPGDALASLVVYVGKTLLPVQLSVQPNLSDTSLWPGILALCAGAGVLLARRERPSARFALGVFWYAVFLLPALLVAKETFGLEHRLYVPMVGLLIAVAELRPGQWRVPRPVLLGAALALLSGFAVLAARRLPDFSSDLAFWGSAARTSPHSQPVWLTLAFRSMQNGRLPEALDAAQRAVTMRADDPNAQLVLGVTLAKQGHLAEAADALHEATRLDPGLGDAWANLAQVEQLAGDGEAAARSRRRAEEASARARR
jgi:hypothetical protein